MREALATYRHVSDPQELADGSTVTLLEQVNNYFVRGDGVVLFTFQWDDIITFDYQGTTRAQVVTRYANVRVI